MRKQRAYLIIIHFIISFFTIIAIYFIISFFNTDLDQGPDFLIIGAQKCGTASLYSYLIKHPSMAKSTEKKITFLEKEINFFTLYFSKGAKWYQEQLTNNSSNSELLTGEATPEYICDPKVPALVAKLYPKVKLIVLLRNPSERAFSHYKLNIRKEREELSFHQAIDSETERLQGQKEKILPEDNPSPRKRYTYRELYNYRERGKYVDQIKHWMTYFPKEQFLIIKSEDFFANPEIILKQVHEFLGIPHYPLNNYPRHNYHPSTIKRDEKTIAQLADFFHPHNKALEDFLGRKFNWDAA